MTGCAVLWETEYGMHLNICVRRHELNIQPVVLQAGKDVKYMYQRCKTKDANEVSPDR